MDAIKVFTAKSVERILAEGGTSSWKLDQRRARQMNYVVCFRNTVRVADIAGGEAMEDHGAAFLIGKVDDVVTCPRVKGRWLVKFSDYAILNGEVTWAGDRNPVIYDEISDLGIELTELNWRPMPAVEEFANERDDSGWTIAEAKMRLARAFGVSEDAVEITIRG
ncbi:MAG: hypothetical protein WDZ84_08275 [Rhodovibrionaceae bacterium]